MPKPLISASLKRHIGLQPENESQRFAEPLGQQWPVAAQVH